MVVLIILAICVVGITIHIIKDNKEYERRKAKERYEEELRLKRERRIEAEMREREKQRERLERMRPRRVELDKTIKQVADRSVDVCKSISDFLTKEYSPTVINNGKQYAVKDKRYYDLNTELTNDIHYLDRRFSEVKETYESFIREYPEVNMNDEISDTAKKCTQAKELWLVSEETIYPLLSAIHDTFMAKKALYPS